MRLAGTQWTSLYASTPPHGTRTWLSTRVELQRSLARPGTWLRAAQTIDEDGRITYRNVLLDDGSMGDIDRASVQLVHEMSEQSRVGVGIDAARDGSGTRDAVAGVRYEARF